MSLVDSMLIAKLTQRIEAIEARQRDHEVHDPECPMWRTKKAQKHTGMYLEPQPCNCWLSDDE